MAVERARRSRGRLEAAVAAAGSDSERALASYELGLFHDNNSREAEAVPYYEAALRLGLTGETRAQCLAWLASSLHKTGRSEAALVRLHEGREVAADDSLRRFLDGLESRIRRSRIEAGPDSSLRSR